MKTLFASLLLASIAGCASVAVTDNALETNTARTLGISQSDFSISDRQDSGSRTDYVVNTKDGHRYACYVTGGIGLLGAVVSDALCTAVSKKSASATKLSPAPKKPANCNALLSAAGKC